MKPPNFSGAGIRASVPSFVSAGAPPCTHASADTGLGNRIGRQRFVLHVRPPQATAPALMPDRWPARKTGMSRLSHTHTPTPTAYLSEDN